MNKLDIIISLKVDSVDRINNLDIIIKFLKESIECNIILVESDTSPKLSGRYECDYIFNEVDEFFNRQRGLNIGVKHSKSSIIAHYDADIFMNPKQLVKSVDLINCGEYDIVYPYDGRFYDVPKKYHTYISKLEDIPLCECTLFNESSVGGVVLFNKDVFIKGGGANENFKGLGYEDNEIYTRYSNLEYKIARISGVLYHLNHIRKETAFDNNPYINFNRDEYVRIQNLNKEELKREISHWNFI